MSFYKNILRTIQTLFVTMFLLSLCIPINGVAATITGNSQPFDVVTIIDLNSLGNCNGGNVVVGNTYNCNFPLTGSASNTYQLPTTPFTAKTNTATGNSQPCTISSNGTAQASLTCTNIPTTGGTVGPQNVLVNDTPKGTVNLIRSDAGACTPQEPCAILERYFVFTPTVDKLSFEVSKKTDVVMQVKLNELPMFNTGSNAQCRVSYKKLGATTWTAATATIANGMCSYTFPKALQSDPYWDFKFELTDQDGQKWLDDSITLILKIGAFGQLVVEAK